MRYQNSDVIEQVTACRHDTRHRDDGQACQAKSRDYRVLRYEGTEVQYSMYLCLGNHNDVSNHREERRAPTNIMKMVIVETPATGSLSSHSYLTYVVLVCRLRITHSLFVDS